MLQWSISVPSDSTHLGEAPWLIHLLLLHCCLTAWLQPTIPPSDSFIFLFIRGFHAQYSFPSFQFGLHSLRKPWWNMRFNAKQGFWWFKVWCLRISSGVACLLSKSLCQCLPRLQSILWSACQQSPSAEPSHVFPYNPRSRSNTAQKKAQKIQRLRAMSSSGFLIVETFMTNSQSSENCFPVSADLKFTKAKPRLPESLKLDIIYKFGGEKHDLPPSPCWLGRNTKSKPESYFLQAAINPVTTKI